MVQNHSESNNNEQSTSREEYKANKKKQGSSPKDASKREEMKRDEMTKLRERIVPIWLRLIIVLLLFALCLGAGLAVGYGVIGDGNWTDVFSKSTWQHIVDLVKKDQ
ncbi:DNA-directed RNA polymerase subunit beta [Pseudalkalibacillus sp. Hm43]|uniref:DNA-directed RNA polymerase subunit beta n=1 Tax=Pseudalkalibacillus sp. Hm43 TaxID=3450742 RepID=UPI003F427830